jgi:hypothetical protein
VRPRTKYARSADVRIAYQITGDGPFWEIRGALSSSNASASFVA